MAVEPFIENLTELTDPEPGDYVAAVDDDAPEGDKDRRLDIGRLAILAQANTFLAANTFEGNVNIDGALDAELQGVNDSHVFRGAAGQVAPIISANRNDGAVIATFGEYHETSVINNGNSGTILTLPARMGIFAFVRRASVTATWRLIFCAAGVSAISPVTTIATGGSGMSFTSSGLNLILQNDTGSNDSFLVNRIGLNTPI